MPKKATEKMMNGYFVYGDTEKGLFRAWKINGTVYYEKEIVNGKIHGLLREYYSNGRLRECVEYENGKPHGNFKAWNEDGSLRINIEYDNGKRITKTL